MNRDRTLGWSFVVGGAILAVLPFAATALIAAGGVKILAFVPGLGWTFWAIPAAGCSGSILMGYGAWTLRRRPLADT